IAIPKAFVGAVAQRPTAVIISTDEQPHNRRIFKSGKIISLPSSWREASLNNLDSDGFIINWNIANTRAIVKPLRDRNARRIGTTRNNCIIRVTCPSPAILDWARTSILEAIAIDRQASGKAVIPNGPFLIA